VTTSVLAPVRAGSRSAGALWLALGTVYIVWGSTYLAIRVLVETMPPLLSAGFRFLIAGLVLATVVAVVKGRAALKVDLPALGSAALVGTLLLAGGNGGVMLAEQTIPSALAALLVAAVPLYVVVLRAGSGDRPGRATVVGVLLGFVGLVILVRPDPSSGATLAGTLTVIVAALSWAIGSFMSGRLPMPRDPFVATVWEMLAGAGALLIGGLLHGEAAHLDVSSFSGKGWIAFGYLITFGSLLAFTAYVWLLHNAPISLVATYAYVNPAVAVILGALLLAEPVTAAILIGGGIVVAGVVVVVTTERPRPVAHEEQPA
jgi:drug/metabolite transporter (DMT)-like permease